VLTETYRELFTAVATCAAGLIGLLFVAISVGPREGRTARPTVIQEIRAASALVAFSNALVVSLYGLVPGGNAGWAAIVGSAVGIMFTAASVRSIVTSPAVSGEQALRQAGLITILLLAFGGELASGIGLTTGHTAVFGPGFLGYILVTLLLIGIARAWELVGNRDTGVLSSIAVLSGRSGGTIDHADAADSGDSGGKSDNGAGPPSSRATPPPE
jgi:hypothetical protein